MVSLIPRKRDEILPAESRAGQNQCETHNSAYLFVTYPAVRHQPDDPFPKSANLLGV